MSAAPRKQLPALPSDDTRRFGTNMRALRNGLELTQQQVADKAGIDRATVSLIENGHEEPRADTIRRLAAVLQVNPAEFWRDSSRSGKRRAAGPAELQYESLEAPNPHPGLEELLADDRMRLMLGITPDEENMLRSIRTRREGPLGKDFFIDVLVSYRRHKVV